MMPPRGVGNRGDGISRYWCSEVRDKGDPGTSENSRRQGSSGGPALKLANHRRCPSEKVCTLCAWLSGRPAVREPVLEAIDVQRAIAEYPDLYRHRIGGVILIEQVPEIEGARNGGRFPFEGPESLALI
jgi:hypothetical protein